MDRVSLHPQQDSVVGRRQPAWPHRLTGGGTMGWREAGQREGRFLSGWFLGSRGAVDGLVILDVHMLVLEDV